ncbi:type IV CRISPR-associated protein Csf2 [Verminephrobacter eiseniae]|uniref:type IV CRISPR-associated protein Csf2 n=1 Tax=Verminephrobacter eiseniae TaxID=364317 RepID=UPI0022379902|nr:type IV CRISPR-associated protein Csf2 [Verminephrobacter eiseniae]MCW5258897.1 type IV CRISPR-associated protein Csf2 [Verminephrobacter eiseniae]
METIKVTLHAFLKTLSPLHIAAPGDMRLGTDTMKVVYGNSGGVPCTGIQKLAVYGTDNRMHDVPVIAANNIIGRLRRHAASKVLDVLAAKGQKVSIQTYSALTCGAATGKPDGRDVTFDEYRETRAHPYIGLFGGGPRMMRRYVRGFNAVPFTEATRCMFERVRHPNLDEEAHFIPKTDLQKLLGHWIFNRNDDLRDLVNMSQAAASIESFAEQIIERQKLILADRRTTDDGEGRASSRHSTKTFSAFEFVVPGVVFPVCFELDVTKAQFGLFLLALDYFAKVERLGGHVRNGLGQFSLSDVVAQDDAGEVIASNLFHESRLQRGHEFVAEQLSAWAAATAAISGADLDRLFAPPAEKPEKKDKKGQAEVQIEV